MFSFQFIFFFILANTGCVLLLDYLLREFEFLDDYDEYSKLFIILIFSQSIIFLIINYFNFDFASENILAANVNYNIDTI